MLLGEKYLIKNKKIFFFILASITAFIDCYLAPYISSNSSILKFAFFDFTIVILFACFGSIITRNVEFKSNSKDKSRAPFYIWSIITFLGLTLIAVNTYTWMLNYNGNIQNYKWLESLNYIGAVLISIRAAITEEIIFRFFLFSFIFFIFSKFVDSRRSILILSILVSSFIFSFFLHSGSLVSFGAGIIITYIFYKKGLVISMIVHFLADVIPFLLISFRT
ncbi:MAG: CPBP family intramembrane metalloprotease [Firmicutes bacterium]|nr:CPBP family intramembrane metalloprotease [Bacillota bacterium]